MPGTNVSNPNILVPLQVNYVNHMNDNNPTHHSGHGHNESEYNAAKFSKQNEYLYSKSIFEPTASTHSTHSNTSFNYATSATTTKKNGHVSRST